MLVYEIAVVRIDTYQYDVKPETINCKANAIGVIPNQTLLFASKHF
jgi:hypothetical protein